MKIKQYHMLVATILLSTILVGFPNALFSQNEDSYNDILGYKKQTKEEKIDTLQSFEILQGNGSSLELDKPLNRAEGAAIYFRLMGLDEKSQIFKRENPNYNTGFVDIPSWAKDNINYLHSKQIVHGINSNSFGSSNIMSAEEFITLILRGLGYDDASEGFKWNESLEKALDIGLITDSEKAYIEEDNIFTKEKMTLIAYNTLFQQNNINKTITLFDRQNSVGYISRIFYLKLNPEEIKEINRGLEDEAYDIFKDSTEKRESLYNKIYPMILNSNNLFNVIYKDKEVNTEVVKITDLLISAKNKEVFIKFDLKDSNTNEIIPSLAKAIMTNGILTIKSDEDFGKASSIIWSTLEKQYPNRISELVYLKSKPTNPWVPSVNLNYKSFELDEANILDKEKNSLGKIVIYNPRKNLDIYFDIDLDN